MNASPIMRDHARPTKRALLRGRHNRVHVLFDVNLDHCTVAVLLGVLAGFLLWHEAPPLPATHTSPYYNKFEVEIPHGR